MFKVKNFVVKAGVIFAVLAMLGAGCAKQLSANEAQINAIQPEKVVTKITKIGVLEPLSGDLASFGEATKNAAILATRDLGLTDQVEFIYQDSKCDGKEAVGGLIKLINADKVQVVIGEMCSGATLAAAPVAEQNKVVLISSGSTSPLVTTVGEYIFRTIPSDALQGKFAAQLVYGKGYKKLALLFSNEDYGVGLSSELKKVYTNLGGQVVEAESFERGATDLKTQITKIKNAQPEAIYLISNSLDSAMAALKQIREQGLSAALFGSETLKSEELTKGAKNAAEGLIVSSVSGGNTEFVNKYTKTYKLAPGPSAAQAYDAMLALGRAIKAGAQTGEEFKNQLLTNEFDGVTGHIKFDKNGDVAGNYDVFVVKDRKFVISNQ